MNIRLGAAVVLACFTLASVAPAFGGGFGFRNRPEYRPFHACLYAEYIYRYCQIHAWESFSDCVIAHNACGCAFDGGYWAPNYVCPIGYRHRYR